MRIFEGFDHSGEIVRPVATIGSYDGVHLGHRQILSLLQQTAAQRNGETTLITFHPHPRQVLHPDEPLFLLNTLSEKLELLDSLGIDNVILVPFTLAFSRIPANDFVHQYLVAQLHVDTLIVGYNHHLGHDQTGNSTSLRQWGAQEGFRVEEMPRQLVGEEKVSSTVVRGQIAQGNLTQAARYLGAPYGLHGVLQGDCLTAVDPIKLLPPPGRYPVQWTTLSDPTPTSDTLIVEVHRQLHLQNPSIHSTGLPIEVKFQ